MSTDSLDFSSKTFTSLPNGERVLKSDERIEACGTIDELNSFLGLLIVDVPISMVEELNHIQRKLFAIGACVVGADSVQGLPTDEDMDFLLQRLDFFTQRCTPLHSFILPGGCHAAALAHVCRTVCRRAERQIVAVDCDTVVPYMNRLSTYFFHLARYLNLFYGFNENYL